MKRLNNRQADELRPIVAKAGVIPNANGSGYFSLGNTIAVAGVYGPRILHPRRFQSSERAVLRTIYSMTPFSTKERIRPGPSRRSKEICKVTREALEPALFLEDFPKAGIDVFITIIQAEAGTRTAGINAASIALADAGIPMRDLVTAVAAGKIEDTYVIDLEGKEEDMTKCDLPVAYLPRKKEFTLLQMDGDLTAQEAQEVIALALKGCETVYQKQKQALMEKWTVER